MLQHSTFPPKCEKMSLITLIILKQLLPLSPPLSLSLTSGNSAFQKLSKESNKTTSPKWNLQSTHCHIMGLPEALGFQFGTGLIFEDDYVSFFKTLIPIDSKFSVVGRKAISFCITSCFSSYRNKIVSLKGSCCTDSVLWSIFLNHNMHWQDKLHYFCPLFLCVMMVHWWWWCLLSCCRSYDWHCKDERKHKNKQTGNKHKLECICLFLHRQPVNRLTSSIVFHFFGRMESSWSKHCFFMRQYSL